MVSFLKLPKLVKNIKTKMSSTNKVKAVSTKSKAQDVIVAKEAKVESRRMIHVMKESPLGHQYQDLVEAPEAPEDPEDKE